MKNIIKALGLSLVLMISPIAAKHTNCFDPYKVQIINRSGGDAELKNSNDIAGLKRGLKNAIPNFSSRYIVVEDMGASLKIEHGPEEKERTDAVHFYDKTSPAPTITLRGNSIETSGFNMQPGQQYTVTIRNQSGGLAKIVNTCDASIRGNIDNKAARDIKVRSGSSINLSIGPKGDKKIYKIKFSTPIEDAKPVITLQKSGWFKPAVVGEGVKFGAMRIGKENPIIPLGSQHKQAQQQQELKSKCAQKVQKDYTKKKLANSAK